MKWVIIQHDSPSMTTPIFLINNKCIEILIFEKFKYSLKTYFEIIDII